MTTNERDKSDERDERVRHIPYYEFITEDESDDFELDMETGRYHKWVDAYPDHIYGIFGAILNYAGDQIDESDITFFKSKGIDLNESSNVYRSDAGGTTPLGTSCEFRQPELATLLVGCGADPNQADMFGFTPFESVLMGHSLHDQYKVEECETMVRTLMSLGTHVHSIKEWIIKDACDEYKESSSFLLNLISKAEHRA